MTVASDEGLVSIRRIPDDRHLRPQGQGSVRLQALSEGPVPRKFWSMAEQKGFATSSRKPIKLCDASKPIS
jgi:hypothetical protein